MSEFSRDVTTGEKYGPAMEITDQAEADEYFAKCVRHSVSHGMTQSEAELVEKVNLGYYAGYYSQETRERVERLFKVSHPVFGSIAENGPQETLEKSSKPTKAKRVRSNL